MYRALTFMMLGAAGALALQVAKDERLTKDVTRMRRKMMANNRRMFKNMM